MFFQYVSIHLQNTIIKSYHIVKPMNVAEKNEKIATKQTKHTIKYTIINSNIWLSDALCELQNISQNHSLSAMYARGE